MLTPTEQNTSINLLTKIDQTTDGAQIRNLMEAYVSLQHLARARSEYAAYLATGRVCGEAPVQVPTAAAQAIPAPAPTPAPAAAAVDPLAPEPAPAATGKAGKGAKAGKAEKATPPPAADPLADPLAATPAPAAADPLAATPPPAAVVDPLAGPAPAATPGVKTHEDNIAELKAAYMAKLKKLTDLNPAVAEAFMAAVGAENKRLGSPRLTATSEENFKAAYSFVINWAIPTAADPNI